MTVGDDDAEVGVGAPASPRETQKRQSWKDEARDALHILPLEAIPLETPGLQTARLIKNVRLQTVVEMFNDAQAGSGQIHPHQLSAYFESSPEELERDLQKIDKIGQAASFDVYTSRIELRRLNIEVNSHDALTLTDAKKAELTQYMRVFTRPLMEYVYGTDQIEFDNVDDLIQMFASPNKEEALRNLRKMADKLDLGLQDIPNFLEEYGDIFLSLAYFRRCLDQIVPEVQRFLNWTKEIRSANEIKRDYRQAKMLDEMTRDLTDITTSITGRFESFDNRTKDFWRDINARSFRQIRELISAHHVTIGGVLCGLEVKMALWKSRFARGGGGPNRRMEFIKSEILPGLSHLKALEHSANAQM